jgi:hypothetical protein
LRQSIRPDDPVRAHLSGHVPGIEMFRQYPEHRQREKNRTALINFIQLPACDETSILNINAPGCQRNGQNGLVNGRCKVHAFLTILQAG